MSKVFKYLKPYVVLVIISIALLFAGAMCDLALPNYMSDIVNVGLQQGGITEAAPEAVSENGFRLAKVFMTENERLLADESYIRAEAGSEEYQAKYPLVKTEPIYVRKTKSAALDAAFGRSSLTFLMHMKLQAAENPGAGGGDADAEMDITELYPMLPQLEALVAQNPAVFDRARAAADAQGADMQRQTGTAITKMYYGELGMDTAKIQNRYIWMKGLMMLGITLANVVAVILVTFLSARIGAAVARDMRRDIFSKVEYFSNHEFDKFSTASLITRTTNDVTQVQMLITMALRIMCYAPIMGVGGVIMALQKSVSMSWIIALACVVLIGVVLLIFVFVMPKFKAVQRLTDRLNLVSRENLSGLMVVRAFGTEDFETERFEKANTDVTKNNLFINRMMSLMMPLMTVIMNGVMLLIIWVGAHQIADAKMQVGDMMAFMQYAMQIVMSFLMISMMFVMVPRAAVSAKRIKDVLNTKATVVDAETLQPFDEAQRGVVEFKNVCFRYDGASEDVLHDISFVARPGETTAFIGSTGSGKSTLINLIPRFYDVTEGQVLVSGRDVREVSQHALREEIGYVPQKGMLLTGTIASNLRYGRPEAPEEELWEAADTAQAKGFIEEKEQGLDSEISVGGSNVSGGQRQRLSIARALVKKAPVNIFDDSFSALDFKTDARLRAALKKKTAHTTMLVVAQRVSTIMNAEQIIVLDEGRIVGKGTHRELLENCPVYREIALSQLNKEELQ